MLLLHEKMIIDCIRLVFFLVVGRSIVIHAEDGGAPRVACADIVPIVPDSQISTYYISTPAADAFQYAYITMCNNSCSLPHYIV